MKKVVFQSNLSRGYRIDGSLKVTMNVDEEEYNKISLIFQRYKKKRWTQNTLMENFIKEFLLNKIDEELEDFQNADV